MATYARYNAVGGGGIQAAILSINGSTVSAQTIAAGNGINVSSASGTTTISAVSMAEVSDGNLGTSPAINWANGPAQSGTLSANATMTLSGGTSGSAYELRIIQGASAFTLSITGVKWPGGIAPVISTAAGAIDLISFYFDGTTYYGTFAQAFA